MSVGALSFGAIPGSPSAAWAQARVEPTAPAPVTLRFDLSARFELAGGAASNANAPRPGQSLQARVWVQGERARLETGEGAQRSVLIFSSPHFYRLLPAQRAGARWNLSGTQSSRRLEMLGGLDPAELLRQPERLRALWIQNGARRTGQGVLEGVPVEIYEVRPPAGAPVSQARAWLRRDNALPVRIEANAGGARLMAAWRNYERLSGDQSALFTVPSGFRVREARTPPPQLF